VIATAVRDKLRTATHQGWRLSIGCAIHNARFFAIAGEPSHTVRIFSTSPGARPASIAS
jgi:hypothetical protein